MRSCSSTPAPIVKGDILNLENCPQDDMVKELMSRISYASVVWSLMYAQICTRLDIAFAVGILDRYQSNPGWKHWQAVKKVMRYLWETKELMLNYKHTKYLELVNTLILIKEGV